MGFNLPIDTEINEQEVFHAGNHDDRGNPHRQYIEKIPLNFFETGQDNQNKYVKVATIKVRKDSNAAYYYQLKFFDINNSLVERKLDIGLRNNFSAISLRNTGDNTMTFHGVTSSVIENGIEMFLMDIYARSTQTFRYIFYRVELARANLLWNVLDQYAYRNITLHKNQPFLTSLTENVSQTFDRPTQFSRPGSGAVTVPANSHYTISLPVPGVMSDCVVNVTPNTEIPGEFLFSIASVEPDVVKIRIRNMLTYAKELPAIVWNVSFKRTV